MSSDKSTKMSGTDVALDTSSAIAVLNSDPSAVPLLTVYSRVFIPFPVEAELLFGAMNSSRSEDNQRKVDAFVEDCERIISGPEVIRRYAMVRLSLKRRGKPIPNNDIWIAACALARSIQLATRDEHFEEVEGLTLLRW